MTNSLQGDGKAIFTVFIGAIIVVVFLGVVADAIFTQSTTFRVENTTISSPAVNTSVALLGRELTDGSISATWNATNSTDAANLQTSGVTLSTLTVNGIRTVALTINDTGSTFAAQGQTINVSYGYEPQGYLERSSDRSIVGLIVIFGALAALVFILVTFIKDGSLGRLIGRRK